MEIDNRITVLESKVNANNELIDYYNQKINLEFAEKGKSRTFTYLSLSRNELVKEQKSLKVRIYKLNIELSAFRFGG